MGSRFFLRPRAPVPGSWSDVLVFWSGYRQLVAVSGLVSVRCLGFILVLCLCLAVAVWLSGLVNASVSL